MEISPGVAIDSGLFITFINSSSKKFSINIEEVNKMVFVLLNRNNDIARAIVEHESYVNYGSPWRYQEKPYRGLSEVFFPLAEFSTINPLIGSQTNGIFSAVNSYVCYLLKKKVDIDELDFDESVIKGAVKIIKSQKNIKIIEKSLHGKPSGPFESAKSAALGVLSFLYKSHRKLFLQSITIDSEKARVNSIGVYLWATRAAINAGADNRVFNDKPFDFNDVDYFLSDQWINGNGHGRSISDLNKFISIFGYEITQHDGKYYLLECTNNTTVFLSKPFLLLAGISGTGKTRFVREQAKASGSLNDIYCLISVRPDWHEPSDLLGYVSRLNSKAEYITTDVLQFIAKAWRAILDAGLDLRIENIDNQGARLSVVGDRDELNAVLPYWLCLDEMNLAPVEQYFADYLSVSETGEWCWQGDSFNYVSDPLLKTATIKQVAETDQLRKALGFDNVAYDKAWALFCQHGLGIPFNLIVAGTVNMDETTHGFSRKVIDRALSFDFGEFFPNDFDQFFTPKTRKKILSYPTLSHASLEGLSNTHDSEGTKTIAFLSAVNSVLDNTPFKLAYRALNELLLAVISQNPQDELPLQAVWDDFLMCKVLPRIEGDSDKLGVTPSLLENLSELLQSQFAEFWNKQGGDVDGNGKSYARPDLYRENTDGTVIYIACRSKAKLEWMQKRLVTSGFTSFWP